MSAEARAARRVGVIAHRGASADRPENTLAAFDEALRQGCDGIELDVQLSRDGVPVVYHDRTLAKAGGGRRRVADLTAAELARLRLGEGRSARERIPTLEQVLERYGGRTLLLLEIKSREAGGDPGAELARRVARLVRRARVERDAMVLSFDPAVLRSCAAAAPALRRVLNLRPPPRLSPALSRRLETLYALSADVRTLTARFGEGVRRAGLPLLVYTCNTPRRAERALRAGAIALMTDRPAWLAGYLERRSASGAA